MDTHAVRTILPPLKPLRAFASVAHTKSFTTTDKDMHLSQSAVSNQIKQLEEYLDVKLFERYPNRLVLTQAGELYAEPVQQALKLLGKETLEILSQQQGTELTLQIPVAFMDWLKPRLASFQADHPGVCFCFQSLESTLFLNAQVDLAIVHKHWDHLQCDAAHIMAHNFDLALPSPAASGVGSNWCLICLRERVAEPAIQAFVAWLMAEVQRFSPPPQPLA